MPGLLRDARFGLRMMRRSPWFHLVAIVVLGLGVAANTAVFSVVDAVLLRHLPFHDPDRLVMVWEKNPTMGGLVGDRVPTAYANLRNGFGRQASLRTSPVSKTRALTARAQENRSALLARASRPTSFRSSG